MDLYQDDISDQKAYPDAEILKDVRTLIASGYREGQVLDYKADLSPKENWPEVVVSFSNSVGGLIIFGVHGAGDKARTFEGFDPGQTEIRMQIVNTIFSRVQPRPDFKVRVVTFDADPTKEIALLRVYEGSHSPYVYSKEHERRVYIRVDARKADADYLQLRALFEKGARTTVESVVASTEELRLGLSGSERGMPVVTNHFYQFTISPYATEAKRRLTSAIEMKLFDAISGAFPDTAFEPPRHRTIKYTVFEGANRRARFGISPLGAIGFITAAGLMGDQEKLFVSPEVICADLASSLVAAGEYFKAIEYFGDCELNATVLALGAKPYHPQKFRGRLMKVGLFEPDLEDINVNHTVTIRVSLYTNVQERIREYLEEAMNEFARQCNSVLAPSFSKFAEAMIADALRGFNKA